MNQKFISYAVAALVTLSMTGCNRSGRQIWADTKVASKEFGRGFRALWGGGQDKQEAGKYAAKEEFFSVIDEEYNNNETELAPASSIQELPQPAVSPGQAGGGIPGIDSFHAPRGSQVGIFQRIHFSYDSEKVRGELNQMILQRIAKHLKDNPHTYVFVEGHCDSRGSAKYNLALGTRRANAIRSELAKCGVNPDQIFTTTLGKERPLKIGNNEAAWRENRRAEFKIYSR
jgi:peptidoglycan-associated lipoprotein